ncbi:hypothetical protein GCM10010371_36510 [Streptomyces subrutilus]|uniref:Uncharacterized protein n=1 Tax=Streptomyces subrutilus TaxID=36818 RepID=A0A918V5P3_9ACTN|nr:hypothetical protein GCM10010371_36510 [Streptomyces subrutilus]
MNRRAKAWSALLDERPGPQKPGPLWLAWVDGRRDDSTPPPPQTGPHPHGRPPVIPEPVRPRRRHVFERVVTSPWDPAARPPTARRTLRWGLRQGLSLAVLGGVMVSLGTGA